MGKKKNAPAAEVAGSSRSSYGSEDIDNLTTLQNNLVKEVLKRYEEIQDLHFQYASLADDRDIAHSIEREVFSLAFSSSLEEAVAPITASMAAATEKVELAAAELGAAEMRLLATVKEKEAVQRDLERILEESDSSLLSLEKAEREKTRKKKWIYPVAAATALFFAFIAIFTLFYKSSSKVQT